MVEPDTDPAGEAAEASTEKASTETLNLGHFSRVVQIVGPFPKGGSTVQIVQHCKKVHRLLERTYNTNKEKFAVWDLLLADNRAIAQAMEDNKPKAKTDPWTWVLKILHAALPVTAEIKRLHSTLREIRLTNLTCAAVDAYINECMDIFDALAAFDEELPDGSKLDSFMAGLPIEAKKFLTSSRVTDVEEASTVLHELATIESAAAKSKPKPQALNAVHNKQGGQGPRAPLTDGDRKNCMTLRLCFYCRKPGHVVANCPAKQAKPGQKLNHADAAPQENE